MANRNKRGIKVITTILSESIVTSKISDIKDLNLPVFAEKKINQIIQENKILYDLWIETCNNFDELKTRLRGRGYTDLPAVFNPLVESFEHNNFNTSFKKSFKTLRTMIKKQNKPSF